jgi:hypothetical protein
MNTRVLLENGFFAINSDTFFITEATNIKTKFPDEMIKCPGKWLLDLR